MKKMPSRSVMSFSRSAVRSWSSSLSTTHGPEIRKNGRCSPTSCPSRFMRGYLGERVDNRYWLPVAKAVRPSEIFGERLAAVNSAGHEYAIEPHARRSEDVGVK